jgi:hypothetical protein
MICPNCHTKLPPEARFCYYCGAPQPDESDGGRQRQLLVDLDGNLNKQLTDLFFRRLQRQVEEEQPGIDPKQYSEFVYESGFRDLLYRRQELLSQELRQLHKDGTEAATLNQRIESQLAELVDYFVIHHCKELNSIPLPEAILRYQGLGRYELNLPNLVFDYLSFDLEPDEQTYTDFVQMPVDKLKNAGKFFLFPEQRNERIFFICDQSLFGSCKEGFAMTDRALYWKAQLQTARKYAYEDALRVKREKDWLLVNGDFFNANPRLNVRMMKLLRKLNQMFA